MGYPFSLRDLAAVRDLQRRGSHFDQERALLWPLSPLARAFTGLVPWMPAGVETLLAYATDDPRRAVGMVQARLRPGRPECVISFLAPSLSSDAETAPLWYRLLNDLARQVAERGVQRIYIQVDNEAHGVEEVLRQAGLMTYGREEIYRLDQPPVFPARDPRLRRQRRRDAWNLLRLYLQTTPRPVQQAEGLLNAEEENGARAFRLDLLGGDSSGEWGEEGTGYVLEQEGTLTAALRLLRGAAANWMRFWLAPQSRLSPDDLVRAGLSLLPASGRKPLYVPVRDYEGGLRGALEAHGMQPALRRSLMVKHTTAKIKEPALKLVPAIEKTAPLSRVSTHYSRGRR